MNSTVISILLLLVLIPAASAIACFVCAACNDPFTSTSTSLATGVNITTGCGACVKVGVNSAMTRSCLSTCPGVSIFVGGTGTACCTDRDYCNAAPSLEKVPFKVLGLFTSILVVCKTMFV